MKVVTKQLRKSYRQGSEDVEVLRALDLEVREGEIVAVLGPSGSGKTTLLSLLAGLDQPDGGSISLDGTDFNQLDEDARTRFRGRHIGIVFQAHHLVSHLTALENVMIAGEITGLADVEKRAREWLGAVGLSERARHFPSQLSGGESQRVALARALVTGPQLLLADEPSGQLDVQTGEKVMELFFRVARERKMTTLLVTHDLELAARCDRQVHLRNGRLE